MSPIRVYNSLTQKKEALRPLKKGKVGMYVCGITAYDACHLGHARAAVAFDVVFRYLKCSGLDVTYVRNFTDIDDKIIARAAETKTPWKELTERYIQEYFEDTHLLNCASPTKEPKATEHIDEMIAAIQKLIENKKAYVTSGGVYYFVREFKNYGKLSHKNIEDLQSGARIEIDEAKKDPLDFAVWKKAKPGEPSWKSPWGDGRPGWHIECSVMSTQYLGQPFDIHGGGRDLIFPHHENEIAQAEGACAKNFCNYFLHNGFININAEKMSKSLKNFLTIKEVCAKHDPEIVRYFLISSHYGSPLDYTEKNMAEARSAVDRFYFLAGRLAKVPRKKSAKPKKMSELEKSLAQNLLGLGEKFSESMDDDFNSPKALGAIFEAVRIFNKYLDAQSQETANPFLSWALGAWEKGLKGYQECLGVFSLQPQEYFSRMNARQAQSQKVDISWVEQKIEERRQARAGKNFKLSDAIRDELLTKGVELKDRPDGKTEWHFR